MKIDNALLTIKILYEADATDAPYVAYIPEFDISSCGRTQEEAIEAVKEALNIVLEESEKDGTSEEWLAELGFEQGHSAEPHVRPPRVVIESFSHS